MELTVDNCGVCFAEKIKRSCLTNFARQLPLAYSVHKFSLENIDQRKVRSCVFAGGWKMFKSVTAGASWAPPPTVFGNPTVERL